MKCARVRSKGKWRQLAVLLTVSGMSVFLITVALFADSANSVKPALQDKIYIGGDTTRKEPSAIAQANLERLNQNSEKEWQITWGEQTGLPHYLYGRSKRQYSGSASNAAMAFIKEYIDLITGITDSVEHQRYSFEVRKELVEKGYTTIVLGMRYSGIESEAGVVLDVTDDGHVTSVRNTIRPIELKNLKPSITWDQADEIIRQMAFPDSVCPDTIKSELAIYYSKPQRLVWKTQGRIGILWWKFVIDAHSGEIVASTTGRHIKDWPSSKLRTSPTYPACDSAGRGRSRPKSPQDEHKISRDGSIQPPPDLQEPGKAQRLPEGDPSQSDSGTGRLPRDLSDRTPSGPINRKASRPKPTSAQLMELPCRPDPSTCCYFWDVSFHASPEYFDGDGDGYCTRAEFG